MSWIPRRRSVLRRVLGGLALLILVVAVAFAASPWPSALLVRALFEKGGAATAAAMEKHVPDGIDGIRDVSYGRSDDEKLDVWFPAGTAKPLTTIVWVHGGGWVSGDKADVDPYLRILASKGFTVIGINYSVAPKSSYPVPVVQTNDAIRFVLDNADRFHVDPNGLVLAGDSAGAQIVGQVATIATSPAYAAKLGIAPATTHLAGTVLNCGPFDPAKLTTASTGVIGFFVRKVVNSYLDRTDLADASVTDHVTARFPPTWISGGNADSLTPQGQALAERLRTLGVRVDAVFFGDDHRPKLGHEYQFDLDSAAGRLALGSTVEFLNSL